MGRTGFEIAGAVIMGIVLRKGGNYGKIFLTNRLEDAVMKYVKQIVIILAFTALGELLSAIIPFPIPAAIYGIVLMLIALGTGVLKTEAVKEVSSFLTGIMPILFVPPAVRILEYWGIVGPKVAAIVIICVSTTFLVFALSGLITQGIMRKKGGKHNG
jgi:holin-like protein